MSELLTHRNVCC